MTRSLALTLACSLSMAMVAVPAVAQERLSDAEVERLFAQLAADQDRYRNALDSSVRNSIIRGPSGEVDVKRYLDDFKTAIKRLDDRFSDNYAASAEALGVLQQGANIDNYMQRQPGTMKGRSEWDRVSADLGRLAQVYGATWPLLSDATARRINDRELAEAARQVADRAGRFRGDLRSSLKDDSSVDEATREAVSRDVDVLKRNADMLRSRVKGRKPATGEAQELLRQADRIDDFVRTRSLSARARTAWQAMGPGLDKVAQGFGRQWGASPWR